MNIYPKLSIDEKVLHMGNALDHGAKNDHDTVVSRILEWIYENGYAEEFNEAIERCLRTAIDMSQIGVVEMLLEKGVDIASMDYYQSHIVITLLQDAVRHGWTKEITQLLLNSEADMNHMEPGNSGLGILYTFLLRD